MKELNGIRAFHCENHDVVEHLKKVYSESGKTAPIYHAKSRPNIAEAEAVRRVLYLAKLARRRSGLYRASVFVRKVWKRWKKREKPDRKNIFVETCTQYLTMTEGEI